MNERERLIMKGIIIPGYMLLNLKPHDVRRIAYESKLILSGIEPDMPDRTLASIIIMPRKT